MCRRRAREGSPHGHLIASTDFAILYHFRHKVNPKQCDRLDALQRRNDDADLKPISFLFSCYAPHAFLFEIFDSYRRIIMQGVLTFAGINGWTTGPAVLGILLALCSGIVMREIAPCALRACAAAMFRCVSRARTQSTAAVQLPSLVAGLAPGGRRAAGWQ